ncbi:MAG: ubiquitin-conjugating enzyme E2 variant [Candidatus Hodarchaeota archaeon]
MSVRFIPPEIAVMRIRNSVNEFYDQMKGIFAEYGWVWTDPKEVKEGEWHQPDFKVSFSKKYKDNTIKEVTFIINNTPGLVKVDSVGRQVVSYQHKFIIDLPNEYPSKLDKINIYNLTPLYHPRFYPGTKLRACIAVRGELQTILVHLIYQILMDPTKVDPFKPDKGLNQTCMRWYEKKGPQTVYRSMLELWGNKHQKVATEPSTKKSRVLILGSEPKKPKTKGAVLLDD